MPERGVALWRRPATIVALLGIGIAFAACDSDHVKSCEEQLLEKLKAPSTYKRIAIDQMTLTAGKRPHYHMVEIEYDAQNSYGALLRDKEICSYRLDAKGRPTMEMFDPYEGVADAAAAAADAAVENALAAAANAVENADAAIAAVEDEISTTDYGEEYVPEESEELDASDFSDVPGNSPE